MQRLSPNLVKLFLRNKYTISTLGGTVALQSVNKIFCGELLIVLQLNIYFLVPFLWKKYILCRWLPQSNQTNTPQGIRKIIYSKINDKEIIKKQWSITAKNMGTKIKEKPKEIVLLNNNKYDILTAQSSKKYKHLLGNQACPRVNAVLKK